MNGMIVTLNRLGASFVSYAGSMFVQAGILIALLWVLDHVLRRRLRASLRYGLWMLVLVKLVLPPGFSLPTGVGSWTGRVAGILSARVEGLPPLNHKVSAGVTVPESHEIVTPRTGSMMRPAAPQVEAPDVSVRLSWPGAVLVTWLAGLVTLSAALLFRAACLRRILRNAEPPGEVMLALLDRCRQEVGLAANVELKLTRDMSSPAVCRTWHPVILAPQALTDGLPEDRQRAILIHELCHIRRADPWVNLAQTLLQVFYFYHPLVWLANASIRRVREQAVDERVLVCLKGQLQCYSHTLIDIASAVTLRARLGIGLIGVSESKTRLNERIQLMLHRPIPEDTGIGCAGLVTLLVLGCTLLPMAAAHGGATNPGGAAVGAAFALADAQAAEKLLGDIRAAADKMAAAFNARQLDALMSFYAPDTIEMLPGQPAIVGAAAMQTTYPPLFAGGLQLRSFKLPLHKVVACGDLIYMGGIYSLTMASPDGSNTNVDSRCGLMILQRQKDGSLKLKLEAYNPVSGSDQAADSGATEVVRCAPDSPTLPANAPLYDQIRDLDRQVEKMFVDGKLAEATGQYTEDTVLMTNGHPIVQGRAALKALCEKSAGTRVMRDTELKFAHVEGNDQIVYVVKWCGWKLLNPVSGMDYVIPGKSLHVWQRQADGSWKIAFDLNNFDITL